VLFLEYERMLHDPKATVKKLAEFMGCGFSKEEEEGGVADEIVKLCSLKELKNMEMNRSGGNQQPSRRQERSLLPQGIEW
jgi:hydroxyjasmonate sulfotransferase